MDDTIAAGLFQAVWESLQNYHAPAWYQKAKFGIFVHWGMYSVPGASLLVRLPGTNASLWPQPIGAVRLLGHDAPLAWERTAQGLAATLPADKPSPFASALKIAPA